MFFGGGCGGGGFAAAVAGSKAGKGDDENEYDKDQSPDVFPNAAALLLLVGGKQGFFDDAFVGLVWIVGIGWGLIHGVAPKVFSGSYCSCVWVCRKIECAC